MKNLFNKITFGTLAIVGALILAGCSGGCGGAHHHDAPKHHMTHHKSQPQEVVVYEATETIVAEVPATNIMKANMFTRSSRGGTSEMGYIKFAQGENGTKMMVDLIDLRPGKDYVVKIYPCGNCADSSCCASKCMNVKLPMIGIDEPGRLTKTYNVRGLDSANLQNAKIVLSRDGGYKAAWGRIYSAN